MLLTGGEINAKASAEIERQRLGTERQNGGEGGEHTVKEREKERDPERCWGRSMGAGLPRLDSGSEFPVVCMTETSHLSSLGLFYSHQNGAGQ